MIDGIYTLANDVVYDQLVALLNSIERNVGSHIPVCILPYDNQLERVREEVKRRKQVQLLEDSEILSRWDNFAEQVWKTHPYAERIWQKNGNRGMHRFGTHRRFCAFDSNSPFERFIYFDADILVLNSLDFIFQKLETHDFVVYDFQYKDPSHVYNINLPKLYETFEESRISSEIFCSGFYASKRGLFPKEERDSIIQRLRSGEAEVLYIWSPDQTVLNYMTMVSEIRKYNFALNLPPSQKSGCCVTSPHFEQEDYLLYDKEVRLTYLHYIGISSKDLAALCQGVNLNLPYQDIFLHYRYLYEPEKRPQLTKEPYESPSSHSEIKTKFLKKLGLKK